VLAGLVVLIPLARLYLGVHYPTDVLVGSGLGGLVFLLVTCLRGDVLTRRLARWGVAGWPGRVLLAGLCTLGLGVLAKTAAVVFVSCLSYPLLLRGLAPRMAAVAQWPDAAWRRANAVVSGLGVGGMLLAVAPLRQGGWLLSVPCTTLWATLGSPLLVAHLQWPLRTLARAGPSSSAGQPARPDPV
jgi:hypothetical protein